MEELKTNGSFWKSTELKDSSVTNDSSLEKDIHSSIVIRDIIMRQLMQTVLNDNNKVASKEPTQQRNRQIKHHKGFAKGLSGTTSASFNRIAFCKQERCAE